MAEKLNLCGFRVTVNQRQYVQSCPTYQQWMHMYKHSPLFWWRYARRPFVVSDTQEDGTIVYFLPMKNNKVVLIGAVKSDGALYMHEDAAVNIYYCPSLIPLDKDDCIDDTRFKNWDVRYGGSYLLNGTEYGRNCRSAFGPTTRELHNGDLMVHDYPRRVRLPGKGELKWVYVDGSLICESVLCFTSLEQLFQQGLLPFNENSIREN